MWDSERKILLSMRSRDMWHSFRQRIHAGTWRGLFDFSFLLWNMPFLLSNFILWESPSNLTNPSLFQSEDIFLQSMWIKETFMSEWGVRNMGQMHFIQWRNYKKLYSILQKWPTLSGIKCEIIFPLSHFFQLHPMKLLVPDH